MVYLQFSSYSVRCSVCFAAGARRRSRLTLSDAVRQVSTPAAAVAIGRDVTTTAIQNEARRRPKVHRPQDSDRYASRQRLDAVSDAATAERLRESREEQSAGHVKIVAQNSIYPPPSTAARQPATAAERPKSLPLRHGSSRSRHADTPEVVPPSCGVAEGPGGAAAEPVRGRCTVMVSDVPGGEPRAEPVARGRFDTAAPAAVAPGRTAVQTPDSGVGVSPPDVLRFTQAAAAAAGVQPLSAVPPERAAPHAGEHGYSIAQTPTKSTIVIISSAPRPAAATPSPSTPDPLPTWLAVAPNVVRQVPGPRPVTASHQLAVGLAATSSPSTPDPLPTPLAVAPNVVRQVPRPRPATASRQPAVGPAATSKFVVTDSTLAAAAVVGGPSYRPVPPPPSPDDRTLPNPGFQSAASPLADDRAPVRLNGGESERRRYVVTTGTLTAVERAAATTFRPTLDSIQTVSESVESGSNEISGKDPPRPRNDDGSRPADAPPLVRMLTPADRIAAPSKPKASTPVAKQRDAKSVAIAKLRPATAQKRRPETQSGQRSSKQSQTVAKQSENSSHAPAKPLRGGGKRQDGELEKRLSRDAQPVKRSVAELRAVYQAR